jgi:hypothetical protein
MKNASTTPCRQVEVEGYQGIGETQDHCFYHQVQPSETLAITYQTTWCHKPEDQNIKLHKRENLTELVAIAKKVTGPCSVEFTSYSLYVSFICSLRQRQWLRGLTVSQSSGRGDCEFVSKLGYGCLFPCLLMFMFLRVVRGLR